MRILVLLCFCLIVACSAKRADPQDAIDAYVEAVFKREPKRAYALLGGSLKAQFPDLASFEAFFRENYVELFIEATALSQQKAAPVYRAWLPLSNKEQALLQKTPQGWWVLSSRSLPPAQSPQDAIEAMRALLREAAVGAGPFDAYMSTEAKEERAARLLAFEALLAEVDSSDFSTNDLHASVLLEDGRLLRFLLCDEGWLLVTLPEELLF